MFASEGGRNAAHLPHMLKGKFPESFSLIHPSIYEKLWSQDISLILVIDLFSYGWTDTGQGVFID